MSGSGSGSGFRVRFRVRICIKVMIRVYLQVGLHMGELHQAMLRVHSKAVAADRGAHLSRKKGENLQGSVCPSMSCGE